MADFQSKITVLPDGYDASGFTNENSLVRAYGDKPDQLTATLTHLFGRWDYGNAFPMLSLTEGQPGGTMTVAINDLQYEFPVVGKVKTTEIVAIDGYGSTDTPCINNTEATIVFRNKWFAPGQQIRGDSGNLARVMGEPLSVPGGWRYRLRLVNPDPAAYIPYTDFLSGKIWGIAAGSTVTQSKSSGNWSPVQTPGKRKNQISYIRKSFRFAGNIANKKVMFTLVDSTGKQTNLWLDFELFQHMLAWRQEKELQLWNSIYSRTITGHNPLKDDANQLIIPSGAGLKQQVRNRDTYTVLTEDKISTILGDVFRGTPDTMKMDIVVYTGEGGIAEFDKAMKNSNIFQLVAQGTGDKFVKSAGGNLMLGGYFSSYLSVHGHAITLKRLPFLDIGGYAETSGLHPVTGRPRSSYEMWFIDQSTYDGIRNLRFVHEAGRAEVSGIRQGMSVVPGSTYGDFNGMSGFLQLATEVDETDVHYMASCGVQMLRDTHSFGLTLAE
jgi:hypothetical protein